jgi:phosphatidylserine/phosphatidylglycerophosphate/cardiolipin synthase-like enzyme
MTPFIDAAGAAWAADIFEATAAARKILVVRNSADLEACGKEGHRLRTAAQQIYEYNFRHERPDGPPDIETFHAKIVLADGTAAYVGSANFLYRSREANLECGFLLEGDAVSPVAVLIEAVLNIFDSRTRPCVSDK